MKTRNWTDVIRAKMAADPELKAAVEACMADDAETIRYLSDPEYAAEMDRRVAGASIPSGELERIAERINRRRAAPGPPAE